MTHIIVSNGAFPFRQLGSTLGRWLRPDPYDGSYDPTNPQSLNRYSYVLNNPQSFIDPSGLDGRVMGQAGVGTKGCATACAYGCHDQYGNYYILGADGVPIIAAPPTTIKVTAQPDPSHPQAPCLNSYCVTAGPVNLNSGQPSAPNPAGAGTIALVTIKVATSLVIHMTKLVLAPRLPNCESLAKAATYSGRVAGAGGLNSLIEAATGVGLPAAATTGLVSGVVGAYSFITELQIAYRVGCK